MDVDSFHDAYGQHIDPATQQLPGQDSAAGPSSMSQNALLNQLIEHSHVYQSSLAQMNRQLDELRQAVVSMANGGAFQGSNKYTVAVDQVSNSSNVAPPPTAMQGQSLLPSRRKGSLGNFRSPTQPPAHRNDPTNQFYVSLPSLFQWRVVLTKLAQLSRTHSRIT